MFVLEDKPDFLIADGWRTRTGQGVQIALSNDGLDEEYEKY